MSGLSRMEAWSRLGRIQTSEVVFSRAAAGALEREWRERLTGTDYRGNRWWTSLRGSQFPGDDPRYCARKALYGLAGMPNERPSSAMLAGTAIVGSAVEEWHVLNVEHDGRLLAASESAINDKRVGFVDGDHWLTGSPDFIILPPFWNRPHLVETKCLAAETRVITGEGTKRIDELAGRDDVWILNGHGRWQQVPFRQFGEGLLMRLTIRMNGREKVIRATPDHRWMVQEGKAKNGKPGVVEYVTNQLQPGMVLCRRKTRNIVKAGGDTIPSAVGVAHGIVYGDGSTCRSGGGSRVDLIGHKREYIRFFAEPHLAKSGVSEGVLVRNLPTFFKTQLPSLDESTSYLYGWLAGYFGADGTVAKRGHAYLDSADERSIQHARDVCTTLGINTTPIYRIEVAENRAPGGAIKDWVGYRLKIDGRDLTEDFFISPEHRRRWGEWRDRTNGAKRSDTDGCWEVVSVEETLDVEPVYCAVVGGSESFVLEDFILTGNTKDAEVVVEMRNGRKSYDEAHARQTRGYIGLGNRITPLVWPDVVVCRHTWRIAEQGNEPVMDAMVCPDHGINADSGCLVNIELQPLRTGSLRYMGRNRPGNVVVEYFFEHDERWFQSGLAKLEEVRRFFEADELPPHPFGGKEWSKQPCGWCDFKKKCCRPDHAAGVTKLSESKGAEFAAEVYGHYDPEWAREQVLDRWRGKSGVSFALPNKTE